jgi:isopenicillin N synthase-like dioxygenase
MSVPVVDLAGWRSDPRARPETAAQLDASLHEVGFVLIAGHGIAPSLLDEARTHALAFFHQPDLLKEEVAIGDDGYRGWARVGSENNAATYGLVTPPDLREAFTIGPFDRPDDAFHRRFRRAFAPNRYPSEMPALRPAWQRLYTALELLCAELLDIAEVALDAPVGKLRNACERHTATLMANRYPPGRSLEVEAGQFRIGPHTDFGTITVLDREPGLGGLQIQLLDERWADAPYVPGTLLVNTGDLMSHWTGGRWRSTRHRVLPPDPRDPHEELLSLVFFHEPDPDARIEPLDRSGSTVVAGDYIRAKYEAMTATAS